MPGIEAFQQAVIGLRGSEGFLRTDTVGGGVNVFGDNMAFGRAAAWIKNPGEQANVQLKRDFLAGLEQRYGSDFMNEVRTQVYSDGAKPLEVRVVKQILQEGERKLALEAFGRLDEHCGLNETQKRDLDRNLRSTDPATFRRAALDVQLRTMALVIIDNNPDRFDQNAPGGYARNTTIQKTMEGLALGIGNDPSRMQKMTSLLSDIDRYRASPQEKIMLARMAVNGDFNSFAELTARFDQAKTEMQNGLREAVAQISGGGTAPDKLHEARHAFGEALKKACGAFGEFNKKLAVDLAKDFVRSHMSGGFSESELTNIRNFAYGFDDVVTQEHFTQAQFGGNVFHGFATFGEIAGIARDLHGRSAPPITVRAR